MKLKALEILQDIRSVYQTKYLLESIEELEELENRSCSNCKHYRQSSHHIYKTCFLIKTNGFNLESNIDFYCNKWENKQ